MCVVCLAHYGLRPRERTAPDGAPKRGRRSFRASAEVPGGVRDDGERAAPESAAKADDPAKPRHSRAKGVGRKRQ